MRTVRLHPITNYMRAGENLGRLENLTSVKRPHFISTENNQ